jgi:hypothetical protein
MADPTACLPSDVLRLISLFAVRSLRGLCAMRLVNRRLNDVLNHPFVMSNVLVCVRLPRLFFHLHRSPLKTLRRLHLTTTEGLQPFQLQTLKFLTSLSVSGCHALSAVDYLHLPTTLTALDLSFCTNLKRLAGLEQLVHLRSLDLSFVHGFGALPALPLTLRELSLSFSNVTDLLVVRSLVALTHLNLSGCSELSDAALCCVACLPALVYLNLTGCTQLRDLAPLSTMSSLETLNFTNCHVQHLQPLSTLGKLSRLDLTNCAGVRSLTGVPPVRTLNLNFSAACADVQGLRRQVGLHTLHLAGDHVADLCALEGMVNLEHLYVCTCGRLTDRCLQTLHTLSQLTHFDVYNCNGITAQGLQALCAANANLKITVRC